MQCYVLPALRAIQVGTRALTSRSPPATRLLSPCHSALLLVLGVLCIQPVGGTVQTYVRFSLHFHAKTHFLEIPPISLVIPSWFPLLISFLLISFLVPRKGGSGS